MQAAVAWFRRHLAWSNSRQAWEERLALLGLLAAACGLAWFGRQLDLSKQVLLWTLWFFGVVAVMHRGWFKLFGPVLFYDLIRASRRARYFFTRFAYIGLLTFILGYQYLIFFERLYGQALTTNQVANFAQSFFYTFVIVQFLVMAMLTPAYAAGAIAEEKERKTLEFILATDLLDREIVLSKLAARLFNLTFLLFAGLPILSFLQFLGGVDPDLVVAAFAATGLTMLSLASLSIFNSVLLKKARDAIFATYFIAFGYLAFSSVSSMLRLNASIAGFPATFVAWCPFTVDDLVEWLNAGNVFYALYRLFRSVPQPFVELPQVLRDYALFHGSAALALTTWSVLRLRAIALRDAAVVQKKAAWFRFGRRKPRVFDRPMVWKEVFAESGFRATWLTRLIFVLLVAGSFLPAAFMIGHYIVGSWRSVSELASGMNYWVRGVGTMVACLMLLSVAVRAAGSLSGERDRQTLDSLLTSPLEVTEILWGKWVGAILSPRWIWCWLGLIWATSIVFGGLHFLAVPIIVIVWFAFAAFAASLGLWFSLVSKSTLRATIATIFAMMGAWFGHWVLWLCCILEMIGGHGGGKFFEHLGLFQAFGMTPPITLGYWAFHFDEINRSGGMDDAFATMLLSSAIGPMLWTIAAFLIWEATRGRFAQWAGRSARAARPAPIRVVSVATKASDNDSEGKNADPGSCH